MNRDDNIEQLALVARLPSLGYLRGRVLPDGTVAALQDLIYTRAIVTGIHEWGWTSRFCFQDRALAVRRFDELQSEDDVPAGHVARRGAAAASG